MGGMSVVPTNSYVKIPIPSVMALGAGAPGGGRVGYKSPCGRDYCQGSPLPPLGDGSHLGTRTRALHKNVPQSQVSSFENGET